MKYKFLFIFVFTTICGFSSLSFAGSLAELESATNSNFTSGAISDADLKTTIDDLIQKAKTAPDTSAETAYRNSIVDVISAYTNVGITETAASELSALAKP